jgi:hypothetical protein
MYIKMRRRVCIRPLSFPELPPSNLSAWTMALSRFADLRK